MRDPYVERIGNHRMATVTGVELSLLITPIGGLLVGGFLYWLTGRPEKRKPIIRHPAE